MLSISSAEHDALLSNYQHCLSEVKLLKVGVGIGKNLQDRVEVCSN